MLSLMTVLSEIDKPEAKACRVFFATEDLALLILGLSVDDGVFMAV